MTPDEHLNILNRIRFTRENMAPPSDLRARMASAENEMRRGLIAMNGAALIAIVSLLSTKLPVSAVKAGAWSFAWGLGVAFGTWFITEMSNAAAFDFQKAADFVEASLSLSDADRDAQLATPTGKAALDTLGSVKGWFGFFATVVFLGCAVSFGLLIRGCWTILNALPVS